MKKILNLGILILTLSLPILASEKNAPQGKIQTFAKNMLNRHTYEFNSWEHKRDKAILCLLPSYISQAILSRQRSNMQKFLKQNEENALEGIRNYFNLDQLQWNDINKTFQEEHVFNLNAMKQPDTYLGHHDENLSQGYIQAVEKECNRYGINSKNMDLRTTTEKVSARTKSLRPSKEKYHPIILEFNPECISKYPQALPHTTTHEFTHLVKGHYLRDVIILDEALQRPKLVEKQELLNQEKKKTEFRKQHRLFNSNRLNQDLLSKEKELSIELDQLQTKFDSFMISKERVILRAACEKTADTYVSCQDPQAAKNAVTSIKTKNDAGLCSYPDNHNDMKVIHSNWQISQAIGDFQNLKSRAQQKICSLLPIIRS